MASLSTQELQKLDDALSQRFTLVPEVRKERRPSYRMAWLGAHLGDSWLWVLIMVGAWYIYLDSPTETNILGWIGSTICAIGLAMGVKQLIRRSRPAAATSEKHFYGIGPDVHSFPSGHAARMGAIATWGHLIWPGWGYMLWPLALWIGWSRVRLGVHYVGDIIAGLLLGGIVSTLWIQIAN